MDAVSHLYAEFEALGEAQVARRLNDSQYHGADLAVAMRWLNEKALERAGIDGAPRESHQDIEARRAARAERAARLAFACAVLALVIAASSLWLSVEAYRGVLVVRLAAATSAQPQTSAPASARP
jgi:hypothetical protein